MKIAKVEGVWIDLLRDSSVARLLAEDVMRGIDVHFDDWKIRYRIIAAISPRLEETLDELAHPKNRHYERVAKQAATGQAGGS